MHLNRSRGVSWTAARRRTRSGLAVLGASAALVGVAVQPAAAAPAAMSVAEYATPDGQNPTEVTVGPDGNVWYTLGHHAADRFAIRRMTQAGVDAGRFDGPENLYSTVRELTAGPDGAVWFSFGRTLGRVDAAGQITPIAVPSGSIFDVETGPDGNLWSVERTGGRILRTTPAGAFAEFAVPGGAGTLLNLAVAADGTVWLPRSTAGAPAMVAMSPAGAFSEFPLPAPAKDVCVGPDGNVWYTESGQVGRMTPAGVVTRFPLPDPDANPVSIDCGPDGNVWYADEATGGNRIGRVTPAGTVEEIVLPGTGGSYDKDVTAGPAGTVWYTNDATRSVGRLTYTS